MFPEPNRPDCIFHSLTVLTNLRFKVANQQSGNIVSTGVGHLESLHPAFSLPHVNHKLVVYHSRDCQDPKWSLTWRVCQALLRCQKRKQITLFFASKLPTPCVKNCRLKEIHFRQNENKNKKLFLRSVMSRWRRSQMQFPTV